MKAVIGGKDGKVAEIVEKTLRKVGVGEALVKMEVCGVCHTDKSVALGHFGKPGVILGHEGIGIVKEIGPGVTSLKVGDRVSVACKLDMCGTCELCVGGREDICAKSNKAGITVDGAMAEECIVKADYAVKVPEGLDPAVASSITCAGITVYKALKLAGLKPGQWVAIFGLGGLGNLGVQYAKNVFNLKVVAVGSFEDQLKMAGEAGADLVINYKKEEAVNIIKEKVGGVHAAVVTSTTVTPFHTALDSLRSGGKLVAVGVPMEKIQVSVMRLVAAGIEIIGSYTGSRLDMAEALEHAKEGKVKPKVMLRKLEEVNKIFEEMEQGKIKGRMVIDFRKK